MKDVIPTPLLSLRDLIYQGAVISSFISFFITHHTLLITVFAPCPLRLVFPIFNWSISQSGNWLIILSCILYFNWPTGKPGNWLTKFDFSYPHII